MLKIYIYKNVENYNIADRQESEDVLLDNAKVVEVKGEFIKVLSNGYTHYLSSDKVFAVVELNESSFSFRNNTDNIYIYCTEENYNAERPNVTLNGVKVVDAAGSFIKIEDNNNCTHYISSKKVLSVVEGY
jgi:hypothetical protein